MIEIPQDVYDVMNNKFEGFDKMYYSFIEKGMNKANAFKASIDRIHEYFPDYTPYEHWNSYYHSKNRRTRKMLLKNKRRKKD